MRWSNFRKMAVSLPLALLAASALVGINEAGYARSNDAVHALSSTYTTRAALNRMMQNMLDAETGLRGYLLTGDERYLQPYQKAAATIDTNLAELRGIYLSSPEDQEDFTQLSRQISRKMSELDLSLRLRRQNNDDAWKFVLSTDVGKENMDAIRTLSGRLVQRSVDQSTHHTDEILRSLTLSRIGIATVVVIGLLAFYMYLRQASALQTAQQREQDALQRERDRLEIVVRERTASLTELANHLQQVREDERGHLARELHDELGALLTAAKLDVARLKSKVDAQSPEIAERLKHLTETLNSGIALKRRIIEDLRPSSLFNLGLTASLEILAREFEQRSSIEVDLNLESVDLPESAQLTVYRMVQESLTNIGKYANATKVLVAVHNYPTHVAVQIRDNGAGFDTSKVHASAHGLMGMRHRVEAAGGRLTVTSEAGEGTLVSAVLPVLH
ncbi:sensor histidine kinase [Acidovorax sp. NCPPB 4044]|uniref:sensor histidine kinase n=1 Tax=Acidovorax sp. NCPPB 4044 TaxID=2940490 RepID=UPI00230324FD|nr:CHASE3 domain-containing protein [Acidovorax sp. NCPPB 4044]MDA8522225.1 CHASE3 domain-containing protein [Acidovorax sp. NCPPB 4044]